MPELKFETGLVTYDLNGKASVTFNPTDSNFVSRLFSTFDELDKKQDEYKAEINAAGDTVQVFEIAHRRDTEMRGMIDEAFGQPVCDALFGTMNVYAMADGLPVWANLILTVMDEVDASLAKEQQLTSSRLQKYTAKYKRK